MQESSLFLSSRLHRKQANHDNSPSFPFPGRVALVTGGNGGIGRSIALGFKHGATVVVTGRNPDKNTAMAAELGADHAVIDMDVRDETGVNQAVAEIVAQFGSLDILVNNRGLPGGAACWICPPRTGALLWIHT